MFFSWKKKIGMCCELKLHLWYLFASILLGEAEWKNQPTTFKTGKL